VELKAFAFGRGPAMVIRPNVVDFGKTYLTYQDTIPLTIHNVGDSLLSCQLTDLPGLPFETLNAGTGIYDIAREDSVNLQLVFSPAAAIAYNDTFRITTSDPLALAIDTLAAISGEGFQRTDKDSISYGEIFVMRNTEDSLTINNTYGKEPFSFSIDSTDAFVPATGSKGNYTVAAGENLNLPILFKPTVVDTLYRDTLQLQGIEHMAWTKGLVVTGYSLPAPVLSLSDSVYQFGRLRFSPAATV